MTVDECKEILDTLVGSGRIVWRASDEELGEILAHDAEIQPGKIGGE